MLNAIEYIPIEEDCPSKDKQKQYVEEGYNEESDEDFHWMDQLKVTDPVSLQNDTYFTFVNQMRKKMEKGTQAWNCYGNRSNIFLLMNYGFCFPDNLYDSLRFMVRLDLEFNSIEEVQAKHLLPGKFVKKASSKKLQEIRLK